MNSEIRQQDETESVFWYPCLLSVNSFRIKSWRDGVEQRKLPCSLHRWVHQQKAGWGHLSLLSSCSGAGLLINLKKLTSAVHQRAEWRLRHPTETEKIAFKTPGGCAFTFNSLSLPSWGGKPWLKPTCPMTMLPSDSQPHCLWTPWLALELFLIESHGWECHCSGV